MTNILQELQEYTEAYMRLFAFVNERDPFLLNEFIANDKLYNNLREEEE